jgi:putative zinc finger/helix-turn-helix YgiT family protein
MARICPICGAKALEERRGEYVFEWPEGFAAQDSAFPDAEWEACDACGEEILSPELSRRIEAEQYSMQGLLAPAQVRAVRQRTGLSQVDMARLLGVGDKSYARWEAGLSVQNKSMDNLIRLAAEHPELFAELDAQREPGRDTQVAAYIEHLPTLKAQNELAMAAHGELPSADVIRKIRRRLQALITARDESHDGTGT